MAEEKYNDMSQIEQSELIELKPIKLEARFLERYASSTSNLLPPAVEVATDARSFPTARRSLVDIPPHHIFNWVTTRGQWIWHPLQGPSGPEGQGPGDDNFFLKGQAAGALCGTTAIATGRFFFVYEPRFDQSRVDLGELFAFQNDSSQVMRISFFCNDHDDEDQYADNSGTIIHTIRSFPL